MESDKSFLYKKPENMEQVTQAVTNADPLQKQQETYYFQHKNNETSESIEENKQFRENLALADVEKVVRRNMPGAYQLIDKKRAPGARPEEQASRLHYRRSAELMKNGAEELDLDIAGSGFAMPWALHKDYMQWLHEDTRFTTTHGRHEYRHDFVGHQEKSSHFWTKFISFIPATYRLFKGKDPEWYERMKQRNQAEDEKIDAENEYVEQRMQQRYGKVSAVDDKTRTTPDPGEKTEDDRVLYRHVRVKGLISERHQKVSMAGPLAVQGMFNAGSNSIENLTEYVKEYGVNYIQNRFEKWKNHTEKPHNITVTLRGHSRGGVAASRGAMKVKYWLNNNDYPEEFRKYVKFEILQQDPVPGLFSRNDVNEEIDYLGSKTDMKSQKMDKDMMPLGNDAETTVFYSLRTEHNHGFTPQKVKGAKRIILMPSKHCLRLFSPDETAKISKDKKSAPEQVKKVRATYTDAATGEAYKGKGISELPEGVYIVDDRDTLIRLKSAEDAEKILKEVMTQENESTQGKRTAILNDVVKDWFGNHMYQRDTERMRKEDGETGAVLREKCKHLAKEVKSGMPSETFALIQNTLQQYVDQRYTGDDSQFSHNFNAVYQAVGDALDADGDGSSSNQTQMEKTALLQELQDLLDLDKERYMHIRKT